MCWSEDDGDPQSSRNYACRKCEGNTGKAVKQDKTLCNVVETVRV